MTDLIRAPTPRTDPDDTGASASPVPGPRRTLANPTRSRPGPSGLAGRCRPLARPVAYYLGSRAAMFVVAAVVAALHSKVRLVQTLGTIFDGHWYLSIAQHGYPHQLVNEGDGSRWAFFPAFPLAVRALADVTRLSLPSAAVAAALALGLTASVAIFLAVREVCGERLANRAVLLFVCAPTAYVLSLGYGEGLFLTAAAGCLFALSRRSWVAAGLWACLAGCSRNAGIVVIVVVVAAALPVAWRQRSWRAAVGAALAPLGLAAFMAYSWLRVGTPLAFVTSERFWRGQHFVWFRTPVLALVAALRHGPAASGFVPDALAGAALVLGFVGLWWLDQMTRRLGVAAGGNEAAVPASWWIYTGGTLLVAFSAYFVDSIARYAMVAFPLFVAFAWKLPRRWTWPVTGVLVCTQAALFVTVLSSVWHPGPMPLVP